MISDNRLFVWISRQLGEIRAGGLRITSRKLHSALLKLRFKEIISGLWAIPVVFTMRAMHPIVTVRVGSLNSRRIGHFVYDGAEQYARILDQERNSVDLFWFGKTCNSQWEKMMRRTLPIYGWARYLEWWNTKLPGGERNSRPSSYTQSRDVEGLFSNHNVQITFLPIENAEALNWLRSKGWKDGEPFICLNVRDNSYMANDPLHGGGTKHSYNAWNYHDYRNSKIETYINAIEWLTSKGVWVIRMGRVMTNPLPDGMVRVIDYAFDQDQSDLLDIWLFANCTGCISTSSGPDAISHVYGKPILFVNAMPLGGFASFANSIWVPKNLRWQDSGVQLSILDQLSNSYFRSGDYESAGIDILDLTPSELTAAVKEFWHRCEGIWEDDEEELKRQQGFWDVCRTWPNYSIFHGWRHAGARIGSAWLEQQVPLDSKLLENNVGTSPKLLESID